MSTRTLLIATGICAVLVGLAVTGWIPGLTPGTVCVIPLGHRISSCTLLSLPSPKCTPA